MQSSTRDNNALSASHGSVDLVLVAEIGAALAAVTNLADLLTTLRRRLKWLLPVRYLALCLLEEGGACYTVLTDEQPADSAPRRYPIDDSPVGWALRHDTVLDIPDLEDETRLPINPTNSVLGQRQGALLVLPLRAENQVIGALAVGSPRVGAYDATDRGIVNLIVLNVAAAVRTSLLIAELDGAEAIIGGMARAVEAKDRYTHGHAERVTAYALQLVEAAGLPSYIRELTARAGPLHDVGKIGVPDHVLSKPGRLTEEEFALIKRHPEIGDEICTPLRSLRRLRFGIRHHHERYDGRGYPDGLAGEEIALEARILAIADAFDAMTSTRPYRQGMPIERALAIIAANEGPQWDPNLVLIFCVLMESQLAAVLLPTSSR